MGILQMVYDNQHTAVPSIIKTCSRARAWHEPGLGEQTLAIYINLNLQ